MSEATRKSVASRSLDTSTAQLNPILFLIGLAMSIGFTVYQNSEGQATWQYSFHFDEAVEDLVDYRTGWLAAVNAGFAIAYAGGLFKSARDSIWIAFLLALAQASFIRYDNQTLGGVGAFAVITNIVLLLVAIDCLNAYQALQHDRISGSDDRDSRRYYLTSVGTAKWGSLVTSGFAFVIAIAQIANFYNTKQSLSNDNLFEQGLWAALTTGILTCIAGIVTWWAVLADTHDDHKRFGLCVAVVFAVFAALCTGSMFEYQLFALANVRFLCDCENTVSAMDCPYDENVSEANVALNVLQIFSSLAIAFFVANYSERLQQGRAEDDSGHKKSTAASWLSGDHSMAKYLGYLTSLQKQFVAFALAIGFALITLAVVMDTDITWTNYYGYVGGQTYQLGFLAAFVIIFFIALSYEASHTASYKVRSAVIVLAFFITQLAFHEAIGSANAAKYGNNNEPPFDPTNPGVSCTQLAGPGGFANFIRSGTNDNPHSIENGYIMSTIVSVMLLLLTLASATVVYALEEASQDVETVSAETDEGEGTATAQTEV